MKQAVASVESERGAEVGDIGDWRWTLTWLEGHPSAELDDGTLVREAHDGSIEVIVEDA
jgi:hypothetical protein